jgi:hypothetical protein
MVWFNWYSPQRPRRASGAGEGRAARAQGGGVVALYGFKSTGGPGQVEMSSMRDIFDSC